LNAESKKTVYDTERSFNDIQYSRFLVLCAFGKIHMVPLKALVL